MSDPENAPARAGRTDEDEITEHAKNATKSASEQADKSPAFAPQVSKEYTGIKPNIAPIPGGLGDYKENKNDDDIVEDDIVEDDNDLNTWSLYIPEDHGKWPIRIPSMEELYRRENSSITQSEREAMKKNDNVEEDWKFLSLPPPGQGHNSGLMRVAWLLRKVFERSEAETIEHLESLYTRARSDVIRAVENVGNLESAANSETTPNSSKKPKPKFPPVDPSRVAKIAPIKLGEIKSPSSLEITPLEAVRHLMRKAPEADPLVCVGISAYAFHTLHVSEIAMERAGDIQYIVPSPMSAPEGLTKKGKLSAKSDANTGSRLNLVYEGDGTSKAQQCGIALFVGHYIPLVCVVDSGGKSIHAFFDVAGQSSEDQQCLMAILCRLGGDRAMWTISQFARLPGGTRPASEGKPEAKQEILYLDLDPPDIWRLDELEDWILKQSDEQSQQQAEEKTSESTLRERAYALRFNPNEKPPPDETCMVIGDIPIAARGNLTAIQGKSKVGKTAVTSAIIGAGQRGGANFSGDTLCFSWVGAGEGAIIHLDTEQSRSDWHSLVSRSITRSGMPEVSDRLVSLPLVMFARSEREEILRESLKFEMEARGGIDAVIIDGVADLCQSPNDEAESLELISNLMALSQEFNCAIFCVLHENPASTDGKTRGHLGSELNRKAFANLRIDKDSETSVSTIYGLDMRKRDIPRDHGFCFGWDDAAGMHVYRGRARGLKAAQKEAEAFAKSWAEWEPIFDSAAASGTDGTCPALTPCAASEIEKDINRTKELTKESTMKKRMQRAESLGVLRKASLGHWTLNAAGQSGQNRDTWESSPP